jgi:hypothetical protein
VGADGNGRRDAFTCLLTSGSTFEKGVQVRRFVAAWAASAAVGFAFGALPAFAGGASSDAAHACQKGGYASYTRADDLDVAVPVVDPGGVDGLRHGDAVGRDGGCGRTRDVLGVQRQQLLDAGADGREGARVRRARAGLVRGAFPAAGTYY